MTHLLIHAFTQYIYKYIYNPELYIYQVSTKLYIYQVSTKVQSDDCTLVDTWNF